jgi:hypothetical protein
MVESLLAMWAAGDERTEDLDQFRQDKASRTGSRLLIRRLHRTGIKSHRPAPKAVAAALYASAGDPKS